MTCSGVVPPSCRPPFGPVPSPYPSDTGDCYNPCTFPAGPSTANSTLDGLAIWLNTVASQVGSSLATADALGNMYAASLRIGSSSTATGVTLTPSQPSTAGLFLGYSASGVLGWYTIPPAPVVAVTSLAGTANQVFVNGGTAAVTGAATVSLPATLIAPGSLTVTTYGEIMQNLGIGTPASSYIGLFIAGTQTAAGPFSAQGIYCTTTLAASANNQQMVGIWNLPTVNTGGFTGHSYYGISAGAASLTGGGSLANAYQLFIPQAPAAGSSYGIYQSGTDANILTGTLQTSALGVGSAASGLASINTGGTRVSASNYDLLLQATLQANTNGSVEYGAYVSSTVANGSHNSIGYNGLVIGTPTVTGDALTSGYMLNVQAPATGMSGYASFGSAGTITSTGFQGAIGATTPSTGAFTTLNASSTITALTTGGVDNLSLQGTVGYNWINFKEGASSKFAFGPYTTGHFQIYAAGVANNVLDITGSNGLVTVPYNLAVTGTSTLTGNVTFGGSLLSAGSLVLGTNGSTTALTLDTSQNATFAGRITAPNITMGSGTGSVTAASGVFSVTSDKRAKNPKGMFTTGLEAILSLEPVLYDFKNDPKHLTRAGFYTQDVEAFIPEAVFHDSKDGMASLDDRPIIAALVNSVKQLSAQIEELKKLCAPEKRLVS